MGVMTLVVYYGQRKWKAPRTYEDMMKPLPSVLKNYINIASYPLIEMKSLNPERFHTQELKELIIGLKYLYNHQYDKAHDITLSHEIAITLAALTKNTHIYKKVKEEKIDMCQAIRDYGKENLRIGKKEGIIQTLIKQLQSKLGFLSKDTLAKIESCNQEQLDSLTIHIFDIHSEKDILHYLSFD